MKRAFPPFFPSCVVALSLATIFSNHAFAVRLPEITTKKTNKFSVWDARNSEEQRVEETSDLSNAESTFPNQAGELGVVESDRIPDSTTSPAHDEIEELLAKPNEEVLAQLRNPTIRRKLFSKFKQYREEATKLDSLFQEENKNSDEENDSLWKDLNNHLKKAQQENDNVLILEDMRIAKKLRNFVIEKRKLAEEMLGYSLDEVTNWKEALQEASPEWEEAFKAYSEKEEPVSYYYDNSNFFKSQFDKYYDSLNFLTPGVDLDCIREIASLGLNHSLNLIEKARNCSNPNLSEEEICERNRALDLKNQELSRHGEMLRKFKEHQKFLVSLHDDLQELNSSSDSKGELKKIRQQTIEGLIRGSEAITQEEFVKAPESLINQWAVSKKAYQSFKTLNDSYGLNNNESVISKSQELTRVAQPAALPAQSPEIGRRSSNRVSFQVPQIPLERFKKNDSRCSTRNEERRPAVYSDTRGHEHRSDAVMRGYNSFENALVEGGRAGRDTTVTSRSEVLRELNNERRSTRQFFEIQQRFQCSPELLAAASFFGAIACISIYFYLSGS